MGTSDLARARARDLADARARALVDTYNRADVLARLLARTGVRNLVRDLDTALNRADVLARTLDRAYKRALGLDRANGSGQPGARRVAPSAASLLTTAARLLPAAHRSRYAEEYQSELWDLAQAGAGRIRQLRYALCQFRNAVPISVALRAPRRRSSVP